MNNVRIDYEVVTPFGPARSSMYVNGVDDVENAVQSLRRQHGSALSITSTLVTEQEKSVPSGCTNKQGAI